MKSFLKILFFVSLFNSVSIAQEANYLKTYFPNINKAERDILTGNYDGAIKNYSEAFNKTGDGHLKDYYNAAVCAVYKGNADTVYYYLSKCGEKGLNLDFVKSQFLFSGIQKDSLWPKFEKEYLEKKKSFENSLDKDLIKDLSILRNRERWFRDKNETTFADTIKIIDTQNALVLEEIIKQKGLPFEDQIGIGQSGMPIISYDYYEIIKHLIDEDRPVNFSNYLITGIRKGRILPHMAAYLMALTNLNDEFFSRAIFKITADDTPEFQGKEFSDKINKWVYLPIDEKKVKEINELRNLNGMDDIEIYRQKILFSLSDNRFLFPYKIFAGIWYVNDPNLASSYLEGTKKIE